jgi:hypothetical protein
MENLLVVLKKEGHLIEQAELLYHEGYGPIPTIMA